ncbi:hypothetical protein GOP47_0019814 [Adiantum capillus-veneris]|uniref:RNA helicase n=1 Tax=Adiantum capillus-veneris TaxID=13818 RepID=A0A9D4UBS1_ADICA|nr:hypothetical protein GOP47_0019814 [Adiantum capillus-veneris]
MVLIAADIFRLTPKAFCDRGGGSLSHAVRGVCIFRSFRSLSSCPQSGWANIQPHGFSRSARFKGRAAAAHLESSYRQRNFIPRKALYWYHEARFRHSASFAEEEDDESGVESSDEEDQGMKSSTAANVNEWRAKLAAFVQNPKKQELISTNKKDRRDYKHLSQLASQLGLHSQNYGRVVAFSKVPLANYRADLDFKRPVRKVCIAPHVHRNVDALLGRHLNEKGASIEQVIEAPVYGPSDTVLNAQPERFPVSSHVLQLRSTLLQEKQQAWRDSPEGQKMMALRASLPAYKKRESLLTAVANNQVLVVSGETGCGKTTQLPQYILESEIEAGRGGSCNIICTQPRRISAMSVAERVAAERGEPLGDSVGYKVRLEGTRGRDTRLLFCTTGILLRRLILDPTLSGVSHVVVDEIHERGMNEDFLLIVLKDILPRRPDLRVILMSATLNAELFSTFFNMAPTCHIPGFTHPVKDHFLEDILELTGHRLTEGNQIDDYGHSKSWKMQKQCHNRKRKTSVNNLVTNALSGTNFEGCSYSTRFSLSRWDPESLGFNLIQALLCHICSREKPGAVLVFMTGWEEITALKDKLSSHPLLGDGRKVLILPCHGSMASAEQKLIFEHPPPNVRKIVLATNMAETSITINDVVFVVDCGKAKETSYDALNNTPCLLPSWISKASARQRRGRAGRVQPGESYHIYPKAVFDAFADYQQPELHRVPLHSLCLQIKSLNLGSIEGFLSKAMQPPEPLSVKNAIHLLKIIGALDDNEELTYLGRHLSTFPVEPTIGKMLVMGSTFGCLEPVLTIAAGLTLRDPFVSPFDKRDMADRKRFEFGARDCSDHIAYVHAYDGWREAKVQGNAMDFCWDNYLSAQALEAMHSLRRQFKDLIRDAGFLNGDVFVNHDRTSSELLGGVICSGLFPRVAAVLPPKNNVVHFKTVEDGEVLLNQNSVLSKLRAIPHPWIVFHEKVKTGIVILRDSTGISDTMLLLFGGRLSCGTKPGQIIMGDNLEFFMSTNLANTILQLRTELDHLLQRKMQDPKLDIYEDSRHLLDAVTTLVNGDESLGKFESVGAVTQPEKAKEPKKVLEDKGEQNVLSLLHNLLQRTGQELPSYKVKGPKKDMFQARVKCNGQYFLGKPASSKRQAERNAAAEALEWLNKEMQEKRRGLQGGLAKKRGDTDPEMTVDSSGSEPMVMLASPQHQLLHLQTYRVLS